MRNQEHRLLISLIMNYVTHFKVFTEVREQVNPGLFSQGLFFHTVNSLFDTLAMFDMILHKWNSVHI